MRIDRNSQNNITERQLSSSLATIIFKYILPCVTIIALFTSAANEDYFRKQNFKFSPYTLLVIIVVIVPLLISFIIKEVTIDNQTLIVRNYLRKSYIPIEAILEFSETRWIKPKMIIIKLKPESAFGSKIIFIPTLENHGHHHSPIVQEMNDFIAKRKMMKLVKF